MFSINGEEVPITAVVVGFLGVLYFGYEIEKQRHRLRQVFDVFDAREQTVADLLEEMVSSGELKPFVPGQPA